MDQELDICNRVFETATNSVMRVCVTIKKNSANKPTYIQIRLFTAKANEATKQVGYDNYILNHIEELSKFLEDIMFADNCKSQ